MQLVRAKLASSLVISLLLAPSFASAQEDDPDDLVVNTDEEAEEAEEAEAAPVEKEVAPTEAAKAEALANQQEDFTIRHGFWTQADLGVFFSFGGKNYDPVEGLKSKGFSNIQPYVGVTAGYDIAYSNSYQFALGAKLAAAYSAGAARVTDAAVARVGADASTMSQDFGIYELGLLAKFGFFLSPRVALNVAIDGGASFVDPDPTKAATEDGAGKSVFAPLFGAALGVEYYTLLNDFSIGLDLRFAMAMVSGASIPGLSITLPMRYTF
jgi:hypothetical protein